MAGSRAQAPIATGGRHLVLYDGVCGLCNRLLQFVLAHDRREVFRFASLQSAVGQAVVARGGGDPLAVSTFYVVADYQTPDARMFARSGAVLFVAGEVGWPWTAARVLGVVPKTILDRAYDFVARRRYRVFGRVERCLVARPEYRRRFVD